MKGRLFFDGACSGNPGPAGYGFVLEVNGVRFEERGFIGKATNNVAEYTALVRGLERALKEGVDEVEVYSDSQLVVRQLEGTYRVKSSHLKLLHQRARELLKSFKRVRIFFVKREHNKEADRLAKLAVREGTQQVGRSPAVYPSEESPGPTGQGAG